MRLDFYVVLDARKFSELRFDHHAVIVRVFDDLFGEGDVLFPGLGRSVDHDGREAAVDGRLADLKIRAVVKVHRDGNVRRFDCGLDKVTQIYRVRIFSCAGGDLQDHGGTALVCRFHNGLDHLHIVDVERADRIAARVRLFEHFSRSDQRHEVVLR